MRLLSEGLATDEVAGRLFLSATTVRVHVSSVLKKAPGQGPGERLQGSCAANDSDPLVDEVGQGVDEGISLMERVLLAAQQDVGTVQLARVRLDGRAQPQRDTSDEQAHRSCGRRRPPPCVCRVAARTRSGNRPAGRHTGCWRWS